MFKPRFYILNEQREPVAVSSLQDWVLWCANQPVDYQLVAVSHLNHGVCVSTVFIPVSHNYSGNGAPLVFETMIIGGPQNHRTWRYSSWEEAEFGHGVAVSFANARCMIDQIGSA